MPLNLSGNPAAVSFGPRRVTNSSKSTWPSPAGDGDSWFQCLLLSLLLFIIVGFIIFYGWFYCRLQTGSVSESKPLCFVTCEIER